VWSASSGSTFDVILVGERVVGCTINTSTPPKGYIVRIDIDPAYQGRGLHEKFEFVVTAGHWMVQTPVVTDRTWGQDAQSRQ
jgi:hypothetical protein